jgi:regulator of sirC expression with transglutaminase-like and TPR domain
VAPRSVIARMLFNLKEIHRSLEDWPRMLAVLDRLLVLMPEAWSEFRDRGLVHAELGALAQAVQDLETYLTRAPAQPDRATIEDRLADLKGNLRR